MYDDVGTRKL